MAATARTRKILVMFEPKTFPITISEDFLIVDIMEITSSGREVPKPRTKTPITKGLILKYNPNRSAPSIK